MMMGHEQIMVAPRSGERWMCCSSAERTAWSAWGGITVWIV